MGEQLLHPTPDQLGVLRAVYSHLGDRRLVDTFGDKTFGRRLVAESVAQTSVAQMVCRPNDRIDLASDVSSPSGRLKACCILITQKDGLC